MSKDLLSRYIWIVDTIRRYGSIKRSVLVEKWAASEFGARGLKLTRRTFYNYRQAIADIFQLDIEYNAETYEYYIATPSPEGEPTGGASFTDWLLNTAALSDALTRAGDVADRIFVEDVPSARIHLSTVIGALREHHPLVFTYRPYTRTLPTTDIRLRPYFLKLFHQRWYITGFNIHDGRIKTYALDRMEDVRLDVDTVFEIPEDFDPNEYFRYAFGIVFDEGEPRDVAIRTDARLAKYLRALPLHHTQRESVHDDYSIFHYRLKLTPDLIEQLLSYGPKMTVLSPPELRTMIVGSLRDSLANYKRLEGGDGGC